MAELNTRTRITEKLISRLFKYKVAEIILEIPDMEPIEINPIKLTELEIINDYDNCYFPVIRISMDVSLKELYLIRCNSENAKLYFRLLTYDNFAGSSTAIVEEVLKRKFTIYLDDATPELQKKLNTIASSMKNDMVNIQSRIEFCVFDADMLYKSRSQVNAIIQNTDLTSAITYLLYTSNIDNVLLSPLDNNKSYDQIIIPPSDFIRALVNLERTYGLYETFMTLYFDLNRVYIIDKKDTGNALEEGEIEKITIRISSDLDSNAYVSISALKDNEYIIYTTIKNFSFDENTNVNDALIGNESTIIDLNDGDVSEINTDLKSVHGKKINTITTTNCSNKYLYSALKHQKEENTTKVTVTIRDVDINYITPNKTISLQFTDLESDKKYGGLYRLVKSHILLTRENDEMVNVTNLTLRKCKNNSEE